VRCRCLGVREREVPVEAHAGNRLSIG
jgi:hypothetical protein